MGKCVVCPSRTEERSDRSFHRFPKKNATLRDKWVNWVGSVKKLKWTPGTASRLCSEHFPANCFQEAANRTGLLPCAVPSLLDGQTLSTTPLSPVIEPEYDCDQESEMQYMELDHEQVSKSDSDAAETSSPPITDQLQTVDMVDRCITPPNIDHQCKSILHDHRYEDSPATTRKKNKRLRDRITKLRKTTKIQKQMIGRMKKKVSSLKELVSTLKNDRRISEDGAHCLDHFSDAPLELFRRMQKNKVGQKLTREKYPPELRCFALTLHFYSPKAYSYVRNKFDLALPHPTVLRSWYSSVDCEAGFITESFDTLESKSRALKAEGKDVICALMLDEMGIKKGTQRGRDGIQRGHVDVGSGLPLRDDIPEAKEALVFMVVGVNSSWKLPIAYFLIHGMTSETLSDLVSQSLTRLHKIGVRVTSLTLDGCPKHMSTTRLLGADMSFPNPRPYFPHPDDPSESIFVVWDACHMLKLVRNCLGEYKVLLDGEGGEIKWDHIVSLAKLQETEGLRAGNKLRWSHIEFKKNIMKVRLAAQTLSSSVADAIEFCDQQLQMPEFKNSWPTVRFLRCIDAIFDFLNVRSPWGRGLKCPLKVNNESVWRTRMEAAQAYILQLKTKDSKPIYKCGRYTGFVGLYTAVTSVFGIYDKFVKCDGSQFKYLLTYKISQDHLELFFCAIRQRSGWCPNPTASQFISAFKRLLVRHEVSASNGNADALDQTKILHVSSTGGKKTARVDTYDTSVYTEVENSRVQQKYELDAEEPEVDDFEELIQFAHTMPVNLNEFSEHTVGYIAGFVVRKIQKSIRCAICLSGCFGEVETEDRNRLHRLSLTITKTRGGLIMPSPSVVKICLANEKYFRRACNKNMGRPPVERNFPAVLSNTVFSHLAAGVDLFPELWEHKLDTFNEDCTNHVHTLIKEIIRVYTELRMYSQTKNHSMKLIGINLRHFLTRSIVWANQ